MAAAEAAERLGWSTIWVTDHVIVDSRAATEYGRVYEALTTLAYVAGRTERVRLGTSVIVVPQRNAVLLAKELSTLDDLSGGRLIVGVGLGWNRVEFQNLGAAERFKKRGAYLEETIRLWRHLWSGATEPFEGDFHQLHDFVFGPLPVQRASLPIWIGGRSEQALERTGRLADGYQASQADPVAFSERIPVIRSAADAAGRPPPALAARVRVHFGSLESAPALRFGPQVSAGYTMAGSPDALQEEVRRWAALGLEELGLAFDAIAPDEVVAAAERFDREVVAPFRA